MPCAMHVAQIAAGLLRPTSAGKASTWPRGMPGKLERCACGTYVERSLAATVRAIGCPVQKRACAARVSACAQHQSKSLVIRREVERRLVGVTVKSCVVWQLGACGGKLRDA